MTFRFADCGYEVRNKLRGMLQRTVSNYVPYLPLSGFRERAFLLKESLNKGRDGKDERRLWNLPGHPGSYGSSH